MYFKCGSVYGLEPNYRQRDTAFSLCQRTNGGQSVSKRPAGRPAIKPATHGLNPAVLKQPLTARHAFKSRRYMWIPVFVNANGCLLITAEFTRMNTGGIDKVL